MSKSIGVGWSKWALGGIAPQAVDQSKLVPLLVAAVQELSAEIPALKIKVGS